MKATFSIFPKFYKHLNMQQLAELIREVGLDTTNLVVRDGYWCGGKTLAQDAPAFVKAMAAAGLKVEFATAGFGADEIIADDTPIRILADNGIKDYRMGYFSGKDVVDVRGALQVARAKLEKLAPICEKNKIRCLYQLHPGTLIPNPSAAYHLFQGLPSKWVAVEIDPGNQVYEGFERWLRSCRLLGDYCVAMGVKDVGVKHDPAKAAEPSKGWKMDWVPINEGITNWHDVVAALKDINFNGTFAYQPFYDNKTPDVMTAKLKKEVTYLRKIVKEVAG